MDDSQSSPDPAFLSCPSSPAVLPPLGADIPILFCTLPDTPEPDRSAPFLAQSTETVEGEPNSPSADREIILSDPHPHAASPKPALASLPSGGSKKTPWYVRKRAQKQTRAMLITALDSPTPQVINNSATTLRPCPGLPPNPPVVETSPAGTPRAAEKPSGSNSGGSSRKKKSKASKNKSTAQQIPPKSSSSHQAQEAAAMIDRITIIGGGSSRDTVAAVVPLSPLVDVTKKRGMKKWRALRITSEDSTPPETVKEVEGLTGDNSGPPNTAQPNPPVGGSSGTSSAAPAGTSDPHLDPQFPRNVEDVVNLFSKMKPNKYLGDMDILDVCAMKGIHFPQPSWWRPGGYDD